MALTQNAKNDVELARAKIARADELDDDYKKNLFNLIDISTTATNGISTEEKIQQMTESIRLLAISQVDFITSIQNTIVTTIEQANMHKCDHCKALKHAIEIEKQEEREKLIEDWKTANGIKVEEKTAEFSWKDLMLKAVSQPGMWVFLSFVAISPYGLDLVKTILACFGK